jgi:transcription antitermination factor NusB
MPKQKPLSIISKSAARIAAVQIFYNKIISNKSIKEVYQDYKSSFKCELENDFKINSLNEEFLDLLLLGFNNNINKKIEKLLSRDWKLNRISAVNKSILFAGIIELNIKNDLTDNIIISEYIEIAEQMGGEVKFINKILDKISKDLK